MTLFFYYAWHSFVNQLRKLFKTWVLILLLVCFGVGIAVGIVAATIFPDDEASEEDETSETAEVGDIGEEIELSEEEKQEVIVAVSSGIILLMLCLCFGTAGKSGSEIFLPADTVLLFASPLKPQSVLLFRMANRILIGVFWTVYMCFQMPNLIVNFGLSGFTVFSVFAAWLVLAVYYNLLTVFTYTLTSTKTEWKKYVSSIAVGIAAVTVVAYLLYSRITGLDLLPALLKFFSQEWSVAIPVYGWIKGLVLFSVRGNVLGFCLLLALLLLCAAGFAAVIWRMKADFYEDAYTKAQETAETVASSMVKRKKDRKEKYSASEFRRGWGADVFFFKAIYNRLRFAYLHVFTKTTVVYLLLGAAVGYIVRFSIGSTDFAFPTLAFAVIVFYRSFGNPLAADMDKPYFLTVPASAHEKVLFSVLGGSLDCALDLLPGMLVSAVLIGASPLAVLVAYVLALCVDFYAENVMLFIQLSLPSHIALQAKQVIFILFIYFGLLPIAAVVVAGFVLGMLETFLFLAALAAFLLGGLAFLFSPLFLERGN